MREVSVIPGGSLMQPGSISHAPNLGPQPFLISKRNQEKYLKALFFFFSGGYWYIFKPTLCCGFFGFFLEGDGPQRMTAYQWFLNDTKKRQAIFRGSK